MKGAKRRVVEIIGGKYISVFIIRFYQKALSPLFPPSCIYSPTCSVYAITALRKYGLIKGGFMSLKRLIRCTPFHKGGIDPVP
jgi:putative membrane protein insertion efficiency factor